MRDDDVPVVTTGASFWILRKWDNAVRAFKMSIVSVCCFYCESSCVDICFGAVTKCLKYRTVALYYPYCILISNQDVKNGLIQWYCCSSSCTHNAFAAARILHNYTSTNITLQYLLKYYCVESWIECYWRWFESIYWADCGIREDFTSSGISHEEAPKMMPSAWLPAWGTTNTNPSGPGMRPYCFSASALSSSSRL